MYSSVESLIKGQQFKQLCEKKYERVMRDYNLRKIEIDILYFLSKVEGKNTAKELAKINHFSKAHVSKAVDNLCELGYVVLAPDESDHRVYHILLSAESKKVINEINVIHQNITEIIFSDISKEEMEVMKNVAIKIINNIERAIKEI